MVIMVGFEIFVRVDIELNIMPQCVWGNIELCDIALVLERVFGKCCPKSFL